MVIKSGMKPSEIYQNLKDIAAKVDISVSEHNFRATGINAKSGLCCVRGKQRFIMDKHLSMREKIDVLGDCLANMPLEEIYIVPAVRKYLDRFREM
jgi:ABC-type enterochelin transport system substrate-binding protein